MVVIFALSSLQHVKAICNIFHALWQCQTEDNTFPNRKERIIILFLKSIQVSTVSKFNLANHPLLSHENPFGHYNYIVLKIATQDYGNDFYAFMPSQKYADLNHLKFEFTCLSFNIIRKKSFLNRLVRNSSSLYKTLQ